MASIVLQHFNKIIISRPGTFKKSDLPRLFSIFEELKAESRSDASIFLIEDNGQALDKAYTLKELKERFWYAGRSIWEAESRRFSRDDELELA